MIRPLNPENTCGFFLYEINVIDLLKILQTKVFVFLRVLTNVYLFWTLLTTEHKFPQLAKTQRCLTKITSMMMNLARFMTSSIDRYYSLFNSILAPAACLTMNVKAIEYRTRIKLHNQHCSPSSLAVSEQQHDIPQLPCAKTTFS